MVGQMNQLSISQMIFFACWIFAIQAVYCRYMYVDEKCMESRQTVERVKVCPKTEFSREKKKHCFSVVHNCSGELAYHCLINPWQNETIEVCAPSTQINQGFCAEYNAGGVRIQDSYDCKMCVTKYLSTEAYKYKECYDPVYKLQNSTNNMETTYMVDQDQDQDTKTPETITQQRETTLQHHVMNCDGSQKMNNMFTICLSMIVISNMMEKM